MSIVPHIVGWLVLLVGVMVSIGLHELGHMIPAKKFGVRVSQYMVGFGPTVWSRTKGETEYGIKAIPLGGFVRLVGMMPPAPAGTRRGTGFWSELVADARDASVAEVRPGEEHRAFYNLSTPKKLVVMFGGPFVNLLIATFLMGVILVGYGLPAVSTTVAQLSECVPASVTSTATGNDCEEQPAAPAAAAGLEPGDEIVAFGGTDVTSWQQLVGLINESAGRESEVVVLRDGERTTLEVTPARTDRPVVDEEGAAVLGADGEPLVEPGGFVGFSPLQVREQQPLWRVVPEVGNMTWQTATMVATFPVRLADAATEAFTAEERSPDSIQSVVGVARISGEIMALDEAILDRVMFFLSLLASLNIALFVFNMIPLLPLDGGHLVNALYEGGKRTVARVRRAAVLPGPADVARMTPVAYVVFMILLGVGGILIVADLVDPVRIT
ncbi:M50 family metallopeptidase [Promicromonospora soli]|uniref:Peptidase n=1 Tax=Promicromonospora soli TaxID=2035533 RepID=A0A919FYR5_9MICO|nr:site-2 protease family protein [Promicromonospora soli]GHH74399.1 peptidase [Promicromonospora soli]